MSKEIDGKRGGNGVSLSAYISGFLLSFTLTIGAYILVADHVRSNHEAFSHHFLELAIGCLALIQFVVQCVFFLHLGRETKPRWKLLVFIFMIMVVVILVFGSIWIMNNLNYHMNTEQMNHYINDQGGGF